MERNLRYMRLALGLLVVLGLLAPTATWAQRGTGNVEVRFEETDPSSFPTISTRITVLDPEGVPISGLDASSFDVFEDGQQVPVVRVEPVVNPDVTIAVALVIDISGSMYDEIGEAKAQATTFVQDLAANDLVAVIAFRGKQGVNLDDPFPQIDPEREIDFTSDRAQVLDLIDRLDVPNPQAGSTPLYDALFKATRMTSRAANVDYRFVLAFTDGNELCADCRGSLLKPQDPIDEAQKHGIPVFTIGLGADADEAYLKRVALTTAGTYQFTPTPDKLAEIYQGVADRLKQQYVVTYNAKAPADGKEHKLDVKVSTPQGEGSNVIPIEYPCPEKPGVRLFYLKPSDVLGQEDTVEPLEDGLEVESEFTIVPDVSACHPIAQVELYIDGNLIFTAENRPFHLIHDFYDMQRDAPGDHRLSVLAYDDVGNISDEAGVTIKVTGIPTPTARPTEPSPTGTPAQTCPEGQTQLVGLCIPRWALAVAGIVVILLILAAVLLLTRPRRREPEPVPYQPAFEDSTAPETPIAGYGGDWTLPEVAPLPETRAEAPPLGEPAAMPGALPPFTQMPPAAPHGPPPPATEILRRQPRRMGWLIVEQGERVGKEFRLQEGDTSIGRAGTNDVVLSDPAVSRQQAKVRLEPEGYYLYDLAATNPTLVNGQEVARHHLREGDRIQVGNAVLVFKEMQTG